jgi:hypothetical protein
MARQHRNNNSGFAQESTRPITQVALYARVSTFNNQDPEMQLAAAGRSSRNSQIRECRDARSHGRHSIGLCPTLVADDLTQF